MRLERVRSGEWMAFSGGVLLLIAMFLPWFYSPIGDGRTATAWEIFSITDALLALLALGGISLMALVATQTAPAVPVAVNVLLTTFATVVVLLLVYRLLINQPDVDQIVDLRYGAYIGLLLAIEILVGAWLAIANESAPGVPVEPPPAQPAPQA